MKKLFYLIGNPVDHSLSPIMQQLFLNYYKIEGEYKALAVEEENLEATLISLQQSGVSGINITIPFKEIVVKYLHKVSDEARAIGCVNTIKFNNGAREGFNTDSAGFSKSLPLSIDDENVVLIGAGGVARAILTSLADLKCRRISIINRTLPRAEKLIKEFQTRLSPIKLDAYLLEDKNIGRIIYDAKLLINATSVGMKHYHDESSLIDPQYLHSDLYVYDVIYNPLETKLLKDARQKGLKYSNGLDMLIYQGLESLKIWLGEDLPFTESLVNNTRELLKQQLNET